MRHLSCSICTVIRFMQASEDVGRIGMGNNVSTSDSDYIEKLAHIHWQW